MEEMYQDALNFLRLVEWYDTDGTEEEKAMATHIIAEHALPALVSELHKATS